MQEPLNQQKPKASPETVPASNTSRRLEIRFPEELPVSGQRQIIKDALSSHQVVIVCGETGSGKTTQLPKICLDLGRGTMNGGRLIGHTQPRRIAATATAKRIAQELGTPIGQDVGYQVRFADKTSQGASIKLMTDGILLAETQRDPQLRAYDTLIIDEAHERSLNIDFLLGYLRQLLPKRPDLKLIITSATIDAKRFSDHFSLNGKSAPVIEVSGRLFPVEQRYEPLEPDVKPDGKKESKEAKELSDAVTEAIAKVWREGVSGAGDVLVFLPGEREIRDCAETLRKDHVIQQRFHPEILSLFARQSVAEQERVFNPGNGRRIILTTNVAETSLTVPNIRYVVDSGLARVKRYSYRNKVEQLQIESISQAAANQRAGRCGRVSDGICIRLYSEQDYLSRPKFTDPEILRSSLAAVLLRMSSLRLPRIQEFPFIDKPLGRAIADGVQLLDELGAIVYDDVTINNDTDSNSRFKLTSIGKQLADLPLDPRIGRMLLAAKEHNALREVTIIASALATQDPRDRPMDQAAAADQAHLQFADERSEFLSFVKLWDWHQDALKHKHSNRQLENLCRSKFLSPRRLREWRDVHAQLHTMLAEKGWRENPSAATYEQVHLSLLTGLLGYVAKKEEDEKSQERGSKTGSYMGARGIRPFIWPGSTIGKKAGAWILAGELQETNRMYARTIAKIEPGWVEKVAAHRLIKSLSEPFWDSRQGEVMAFERGTLYGLPIYHGRRVRYEPHNPKDARNLFITQALVQEEMFGRMDSPALMRETEADARKKYPGTFEFFWHNRRLIKEIEALEHRSRRPDVLVDDDLLFAFYDSRIPEDVLSRESMKAWLLKTLANKGVAEESPDSLLRLAKADLMRHEAAGITVDRYPKKMMVGGSELSLTYHFEPGSPKDGVTLVVPLTLLNQVDGRRCDWLVPGMCEEKIGLLLKSLPQKLRRHCLPLPEYAKSFLERMLSSKQFGVGDFLDTLITDIRKERGLEIKRTDFRPESLPLHSSMNFRLVDEHGRQLELERNLSRLRAEYGETARTAFQAIAQQAVHDELGSATPVNNLAPIGKTNQSANASLVKTVEQGGYRSWDFGELPETLEIQKGNRTLFGYPALVDRTEACDLEVFDDLLEARKHHWQGLRRLFALSNKDTLKALQKQLPGIRELGLLFINIGSVDSLIEQILNLALERAFMNDPLPVNAEQFAERLQAGKPRLALIAQEISKHALAALQAYADLQKKLSQAKAASATAHVDIQNQVQGLIFPKFVSDTPYSQLVHFPRYLKAIAMRIDKLRANPSRDSQCQKDWESVARPWQKLVQAGHGSAAYTTNEDQALADFRWQLEELRVALYAQELKTPSPMSLKRLEKVLASLR
ncbi:ATP-dependent RNA helicase HrpA [Polynucleobacter sp. AP-Sving-400A-A2]|uniref:ATP-dependent RNA helicase HrpA n=1 Tax=Polynucleobacter sp. AP-Sving-400A-A2 TaxID=2081049 RepID=UPI00203EBB92|nr:ATP-dependent RNA helicase HrpA [Polynucleobacter sp. AP-Sving-400A-A2]QWE13721.1 ATP-dependent RNA helicase HrpA [Polynucleobacter sp. AP-Sving-400A-A2]